MHLKNKHMATTEDLVARLTILEMSKAALADLVVDMLRAENGDERLDGEPLARAFVLRMKPIAAFREDPEPKMATTRLEPGRHGAMRRAWVDVEEA